ncbi:MAG TPA: hypothetical protein EYN92_07840, partial [Dehalococcoidia bacterium]|nr:hypothetical protein [Dehalococcoidia bacterium]
MILPDVICKVEKSRNRYIAWSSDGTNYSSDITSSCRKNAFKGRYYLGRFPSNRTKSGSSWRRVTDDVIEVIGGKDEILSSFAGLSTRKKHPINITSSVIRRAATIPTKPSARTLKEEKKEFYGLFWFSLVIAFVFYLLPTKYFLGSTGQICCVSLFFVGSIIMLAAGVRAKDGDGLTNAWKQYEKDLDAYFEAKAAV